MWDVNTEAVVYNKKRFLFDSSWAKMEGVTQAVERGWNIQMDGTPMYQTGIDEYNWVPGLNGGKPALKVNIDPSLFTVNHLLCNSGLSWDENLVRILFHDRDATEILNIRGLDPRGEDLCLCNFAVKGNFSVHAAYVSMLNEKI
ncbi:exodeoxyribonuclease 7 small subunit, partial [Striga asiatica]